MRLDKKGDFKFLGREMIIPLMGFIVILGGVMFTYEEAQASDAHKLASCAASLKAGKVIEESTGPLKYFFDRPDICSTIEKSIPQDGNSKDDIEKEIMEMVAKSWKETLEGEPSVFNTKMIPSPECFIAYRFEIAETRNFKQGAIIDRSTFFNDLGFIPYKKFDIDGSLVEYTYLDYVQDYPYAGRGQIEVFPQPKDLCGTLDRESEECKRKVSEYDEKTGFKPKGIYAIAVLSPQGSLKFLSSSKNSINSIIVDEDAKMRGLCHETT